MGVLVVASRRTSQLRALVADRRTLALLALAAVEVTVNWATYIWGVNNGRVVETSLGYFINPLVTVLMGVFILGERLRPLQWAALGVAAGAVGVLTVDYGRLAAGRAGAGLLVRHLRPGEEDRRRRRRREPDPRDDGHRPGRRGVRRVARRDGGLELRRRTGPATRCSS